MLFYRASEIIFLSKKTYQAYWIIFCFFSLSLISSSLSHFSSLLFSSAFCRSSSSPSSSFMHGRLKEKAFSGLFFDQNHFSTVQLRDFGLKFKKTNSLSGCSKSGLTLGYINWEKSSIQRNKVWRLKDSQNINRYSIQNKFHQYKKQRIHQMSTSLSATSSTSSPSTSNFPSSVLPYLPMIESSVDVILASKSPRRQEIFQLMGIPSTSLHIIPSSFPEDLDKSQFEDPGNYALTNARYKVHEVAERIMLNEDKSQNNLKDRKVFVGSDTIVEIDGKILEKPGDEKEAIEMMKALSGRDHYVHSGVAIFSSACPLSDGPIAEFYETTKVTFTALTEDDIHAYIATREPFDKAGGYGIQGYGGQFVSSLTGCYFNVMGFPMHKFSKTLSKLIDEKKI